MTARIHMFPNSGLDVAVRVLKHAHSLKASDPAQSIELHEEVVGLLFVKLQERNRAVRVLKHMLLKRLRDGDDE